MKNKIFKKAVKNFYKCADWPEYVSPDCISVYIYNKNKLTLQGSYEIIKYSNENISLKLKDFVIAVFGENLIVSAMKNQFIVIEGSINKAEYIDL